MFYLMMRYPKSVEFRRLNALILDHDLQLQQDNKQLLLGIFVYILNTNRSNKTICQLIFN